MGKSVLPDLGRTLDALLMFVKLSGPLGVGWGRTCQLFQPRPIIRQRPWPLSS